MKSNVRVPESERRDSSVAGSLVKDMMSKRGIESFVQMQSIAAEDCDSLAAVDPISTIELAYLETAGRPFARPS